MFSVSSINLSGDRNIANSFPTRSSSSLKSLLSLTVKISLQSLRSGLGLTISSNNSWLGSEEMALRMRRPITSTTDTYRPIILWKERKGLRECSASNKTYNSVYIPKASYKVKYLWSNATAIDEKHRWALRNWVSTVGQWPPLLSVEGWELSVAR